MKFKNYLTVGAMLLITLNPFSSYAYSTKYSIKEPIIIQEQNYPTPMIQRVIPLPPIIPDRMARPTRNLPQLPPAPRLENLERSLKPVKEVRLEFP